MTFKHAQTVPYLRRVFIYRPECIGKIMTKLYLRIQKWYTPEIFTSKSPWQKKFIEDVFFQILLTSGKMHSSLKTHIHKTRDKNDDVTNQLLLSGAIHGLISTLYHLWKSRFQGGLYTPHSLPEAASIIVIDKLREGLNLVVMTTIQSATQLIQLSCSDNNLVMVTCCTQSR